MDNLTLLDGLNKDDKQGILSCLDPVKKHYNKGEIILHLSDEINNIGVMESGLAYLIMTDVDGQRSIVDYYNNSDIFGRPFTTSTERNSYYIIAKTKCTISFIDYNKLITCCKNGCGKHYKLIRNMFSITVAKSQMHIDILSQRNIKNKIMTYFYYINKLTGMKNFRIPLSLTDLADYISADRSAMMRELKKLNENKIIISKGRNIILL